MREKLIQVGRCQFFCFFFFFFFRKDVSTYKIFSVWKLRVMFYSVGSFRASIPETTISSNHETALRRQGEESVYIEVCNDMSCCDLIASGLQVFSFLSHWLLMTVRSCSAKCIAENICSYFANDYYYQELIKQVTTGFTSDQRKWG